jgi:hypothetical protein
LRTIYIPSSVEILCGECFTGCSSLSSLIFGSDSKLTQIESKAFGGCAALKSISIPEKIRQLDQDWYVGGSFARVEFESSLSLQRMMEHRKIDLTGRFDIHLVDWDGVMSFPGYSVVPIPGVENSARLMKNE